MDHGEEVEYWHVEAVRIDDADTVIRLGTYASDAEARAALAVAQEDLLDLTKSRFEAAYFSHAEAGDTGVE